MVSAMVDLSTRSDGHDLFGLRVIKLLQNGFDERRIGGTGNRLFCRNAHHGKFLGRLPDRLLDSLSLGNWLEDLDCWFPGSGLPSGRLFCGSFRSGLCSLGSRLAGPPASLQQP